MTVSDTVDPLRTALADRYRIERELGQGGMATVYLAHDVKHDRKVAVKVLRPELAAMLGAERFVQEIKTTAHLQHPHILPLFDSGEAAGFLYYVMPFVEGETLRQKLNRETQLAVEDAVRISCEVADALDYAHRHAVIHRDIKPENILLHDGRATVADFGIALAVSAAAGGRMTETGLSLGTPHYMSPEQATADKNLTGRSDIYSLGCVLYEMLTGNPPHTGSSAQQIIMKIVTEEAQPVTKLRRAVPPNVAAALGKSLEKLPADRFPSAAAFATALSDPLFRHAEPAVPAGGVGIAIAVTRRPRVLIGIAALGWIAALGLAVVRTAARRSTDGAARRLAITLPPSAPLALAGASFGGIWQRAVDIRRDGSMVVYVAAVGNTTRLHVRRLGATEVTALAGTDSAYCPFFSPDGQWIGFFVGQELRKIPVEGGQPVTLRTGLRIPVGASWGRDGRIFVANYEGREPMWIPEAGGTGDSLGTLGRPFVTPHLLPDGKKALVSLFYTYQLGVYSTDDGTVSAITRHGLTQDTIPTSDWLVGYNPVYTSSGYILYLTPGDGVLMALPFDAKRLRVRGDPQPVLGNVRKEESYGFGQFAVSEDGTLVYAAGGNADLGLLAMVDGSGRVDTLPFGRALYENPRLAPDGRTLAATVRNELGARASYLFDLDTGHRELLTLPDQEVMSWFGGDDAMLLRKRWEGGGRWWYGPPTDPRITLYSRRDGSSRAVDIHRVVFLDAKGQDGALAWSDRQYGLLVRSHFTDTATTTIPDGGTASISPDGNWLAYVRSDQALVVASVAEPGKGHEIGRGDQPQWRGRGLEVIYWGGRRTFWEVELSRSGSGLIAGKPKEFARGPFVRVRGRAYDVAPDGRLLVVLGSFAPAVASLEIVTNFRALLNRRH